ncbi:LAMI_0C07734g1_1 [Lachancea mirantina]|uniref:tRNA pseudouridine(55) synthase n=1 Tax=Lachancea mirantina TaxID=1230905 RepID=A0A1G4J461_9SACH|nr:LAMI_0C07734g1_1 [Lachancea mirantina]
MNGIFAIEKPSGISSSQFLLKVQQIFNNSHVFSREIQRATAERMRQFQEQTGKKASKRKLRKVSKVKMGHGGTLDPLASGVLVVGVGSGTKKLSQYLSGTVKVYEAEALFGLSTTSGDVEGDILTMNSVDHLNMKDLKSVEQKFVGSLKQTPPIYAALKMDGKPLHEYARKGIPLPRAIEAREVNIYDLTILPDSLSTTHNYELKRPSTEEAQDTVTELTKKSNLMLDKLYFSKEYCKSIGLENEEANVEEPIPLGEEAIQQLTSGARKFDAPLLHFKARVSSGTYIRSLVSDIGKAMRSSSYMVKLIRCQQENWALEKNNVFSIQDFSDYEEEVWSSVLEKVMEEGSSIDVKMELENASKELELKKKGAEAALEKDSKDAEESSELNVKVLPEEHNQNLKRPLEE